MADLGTIGGFRSAEQFRKTDRTWGDSTKVLRCKLTARAGFGYRGPSSTVSGVVMQDGSAVARLVRVYRRDTGELVGYETSGLDGVFSVSLHGYAGEVFIIAFDDALSAPNYNAQIYDRVVPA